MTDHKASIEWLSAAEALKQFDEIHSFITKYIAYPRARLESVLTHADYVWCCRDPQNRIAGSTAVRRISVRSKDSRATVLYTAAVALSPAARRQGLFAQMGFQSYLIERRRSLFEPLYWLSLAATPAGYLQMAQNVLRFWPNRLEKTPAKIQSIIEQALNSLESRGLERDDGVFRLLDDFAVTDRSQQAARWDRGIADVEFFLRANPSYAQGSNLACIAPLDVESFAELAVHRLRTRAFKERVPRTTVTGTLASATAVASAGSASFQSQFQRPEESVFAMVQRKDGKDNPRPLRLSSGSLAKTVRTETVREPRLNAGREGIESEVLQPGLLIVHSAPTPQLTPISLGLGRQEFGRNELASLGIEDEMASRRHFAIERTEQQLTIVDLGSTNGVFVDGVRMQSPISIKPGERAVVRLGRTVIVALWNVGLFEAAALRPMLNDNLVVGPLLRFAHRQIAALGAAGEALFLSGESGAGKEIAARIFHQASPRSAGPFIAVNCAAVPKDIAERLFFGTVRGAYSGAVADAQGYLQAAHRGTLFLDEVAELDLSVQAKLLRVLETKQVLPLGATRAQTVDLGLCAATLKDLREAVGAGKFREDLYYRIARPEVRLPPLRERFDEIAFLIDRIVRPMRLTASASLVEACLLRPWPGNVRELFAEVKAAAVLAQAEESKDVRAEHLSAHAGLPMRSATATPTVATTAASVAMGSASTAASSGVPVERVEPNNEPHSESVSAELVIQRTSESLGLAQKTVRKLLSPEQLITVGKAMGEAVDSAAVLALLRAAVVSSLTTLLRDASYNQSTVAAQLGVSRTTLMKLMKEFDLAKS